MVPGRTKGRRSFAAERSNAGRPTRAPVSPLTHADIAHPP